MATDTTAAASWGDIFKNALSSVVDTAAVIAVKKVDAKQSVATAEAEATQAQAQAANVQAQAASTEANWKKYAIIGGGVLLGVVALAFVLRSSSK